MSSTATTSGRSRAPERTHDTDAGDPRAVTARRGHCLNHEPACADETGMGRLVFYPITIGLFVLLDMALRAHGH
jgi:hypothetical protein